MRFFIHLMYDGGAYCGWQIQDNAPTVQGELQRALSLMLRTQVSVTGAGRTDTGVHALSYTAHFDSDDQSCLNERFTYRLNRILPNDISVLSITRVRDSAHARFDAVEREYRYYITSRKDPFLRHSSWNLSRKLDIDAMNRAASFLTMEEDFTSFAKLNSSNKTNICHVSRAIWTPQENGCFFSIVSDRFLRNMVRGITGTLVDVGTGRYTPERFREILQARDLSLCSTSAPAQGLFLYRIKYPENILNITEQTCQ